MYLLTKLWWLSWIRMPQMLIDAWCPLFSERFIKVSPLVQEIFLLTLQSNEQRQNHCCRLLLGENYLSWSHVNTPNFSGFHQVKKKKKKSKQKVPGLNRPATKQVTLPCVTVTSYLLCRGHCLSNIYATSKYFLQSPPTFTVFNKVLPKLLPLWSCWQENKGLRVDLV